MRQALENGELRELLEDWGGQLGVRFRRLYRWTPPRGGLNAQVRGFGPWRSLYLTDDLLDCPRDEILAIFAHEVGHVRLRHVEKRLFWVAVAALPALMIPLWAWVPLFFAFVWGFLLGPLSRRFELDADVFSVHAFRLDALVAALARRRFRHGDRRSRGHPSPTERIVALWNVRHP